jgi:hypothetical protein
MEMIGLQPAVQDPNSAESGLAAHQARKISASGQSPVQVRENKEAMHEP